MLGRSTNFAVVLFVLAGLVIAGCGGTSTTTTVTSATASSAGGSASGFTAIPTVKCKTVEGVSRPAARLNATTPVPIPPSLKNKLAAYRNTGGTIVVAPVGYECKGGIGVDGSEFVAAYPKDSPYAGERPAGEPGTVVSLNIASACQGCIAEAICTLFPEAKPVGNYYGTIGGSKCPEKPLREEVSYPAKSTALFSDPPRVSGSGLGSGGVDPSVGAISYFEPIGVRKLSCTLPPEESELCTAIVGATFTAVPLGY